MRVLTAIAGALLLVSAPVAADPSDDLDALMQEVWEWQLAGNPVFASRLGDRRYNRRWADPGLDAIERRHQEARQFLRRLYAIPREGLEAEVELNYELFRRYLQDIVDRHQFNAHLLPFSQRGGVQNLESQAEYLPFSTTANYDDWLARMRGVGAVIDATIGVAERGMREGYVAPAVLMERIPPQIDRQLVDEPEASPWFDVFESMPDSIPEAERERLRDEARTAIDDVVLPAYRDLARFFERDYLPSARDSVGLSSLPNGEAWYEYLARRFTTTRMSPDEIHRLGLDEVKRIRGEMQAIIDELGYEGDFASFLEYLRTDPQFYFDDPDALYEAYLATSKRIDPELVRLFGKLPRMPYGVKPIPDSIAPDTTTAYYSRPAADGSRAGIYWVNLYRPEVRPKYEIEVLTVHEAMPGHHLQLALQQELGEMPAFRRYAGYEDPYSRFGQLTYEMWRAVRLVVDTGLHYRGWTRQQAIDFFKANAAKTEHDIVNEIDRYIGNPGQALAYKIGQIRIQSLRDNAEALLGDDFDIRAFHDELLGAGALPLDLLQQRMDAWLEAELGKVPE